MDKLLDINPNIVSEVANKVDDSTFNDFEQYEYEEAVLKAYQDVAKRYDILARTFSFTPTEEGEISLPLNSLRSEISVKVNGDKFVKEDASTFSSSSEDRYTLYRDNSKWKFDYYPKGDNDKITITFIANPTLEDWEIEETTPVLPEHFRNEVVASALNFIAEKGIIKFKGDKSAKYTKVKRLFSKRANEIDPQLYPNDETVKIKCFLPV